MTTVLASNRSTHSSQLKEDLLYLTIFLTWVQISGQPCVKTQVQNLSYCGNLMLLRHIGSSQCTHTGRFDKPLSSMGNSISTNVWFLEIVPRAISGVYSLG